MLSKINKSKNQIIDIIFCRFFRRFHFYFNHHFRHFLHHYSHSRYHLNNRIEIHEKKTSLFDFSLIILMIIIYQLLKKKENKSTIVESYCRIQS